MAKRFALVAWWLGALYAGIALLGILFTAKAGQPDATTGVAVICTSVGILTGALWSLAFVLGGSFWRPPR